ALLLLRNAGRRAPQLGGIVKRQRLAERLEDGVVDVVVFQIAHLAAQVGWIQRQQRIEQVVQQLAAQGGPLRRADRQRLKDQSGFREAALDANTPDAPRL